MFQLSTLIQYRTIQAIRILTMIPILANALVVAGIGILVAGLWLARRLLIHLPPGKVRRAWYAMAGLIIVFILGYAAFLIPSVSRFVNGPDLVFPVLLFLGSCFVWTSCRISLQAVEDVRRAARWEQESLTDPLTGMYNRRYMERRLEQEFARAQRDHTPVSVLLLDIDYFKNVNDEWGHLAGDRVMSWLGKLVQDSVRASDAVVRYGGDELLIVTPGTPLAAAAKLAERLRERIETQPLEWQREDGERQDIRVRACIGVAACAADTEDVQKLLRAADAALYRAKREGRNRVIVQEPC